MKIGTLEKRITIGLQFFAKFFNTVSDQQVELVDSSTAWTWKILQCPMCSGRTADAPVCHLAVGVLQAALENFADKDKRFRITPTECIAMGHEAGTIVIEKDPM